MGCGVEFGKLCLWSRLPSIPHLSANGRRRIRWWWLCVKRSLGHQRAMHYHAPSPSPSTLSYADARCTGRNRSLCQLRFRKCQPSILAGICDSFPDPPPPPPSVRPPSLSRPQLTADTCRHNEVHGITPSVATAASVGDSILDSINGDGTNVNQDGRGVDNDNHDDGDDHVASWAGHALPPDQVRGASSRRLYYMFVANAVWGR